MPDSALGADGVELGNGRNDGVNRLYVPDSYGGFGYELTYSGGLWDAPEIYSGIGPHCTPRLGSLGGSLARLYTGVVNESGLGVFTYDTTWSPMTVIEESRGRGRILAIRIGDGRNDGVDRLYAAGDGGLFEYGYDNGGYSDLPLLTVPVGGFGLGDGRGDGLVRVYAGERDGTQLHEFTWNGTGFEDTVIFDCNQPSQYTAHVGDGRGDGVERVYAWCGGIYELTFNGDDWTRVVVDEQDAYRFYIDSGRVRADNRSRLYVSQRSEGLAEYTWNVELQAFSVDVISAATGGVTVGDGRGDGKNRLYVAGGSNGSYSAAAVVELSSSDPPAAQP